MKAVMWTDVVQICFMVAGIVAVIIKGSVDHGGFTSIWSIMYDGDRIQFWEYVHPFVSFVVAVNGGISIAKRKRVCDRSVRLKSKSTRSVESNKYVKSPA